MTMGIAILLAIIVHFLSLGNSFDRINFLSYFTVLSNLFVAAVLIITVFKNKKKEIVDNLRGAATLYILNTALGFTVLLGGKNDEFLPWVNLILHYISPFYMLLDWVMAGSDYVSFKKSIKWLIPALVYLTYTFVRGSFTGWYPYSFLSPSFVGITGVIQYIVMLLIFNLVAIRVMTFKKKAGM